MDLPIDHCRLLGVGPSATANAIFKALQLRLNHYPNQGFTHEALSQRGELLRISADLLTKSSSCRQLCEFTLSDVNYNCPTEKTSLYIPAAREVGGLILLWEAQAPREALHLAVCALHAPENLSIGGKQIADLTLLVALACRDVAKEEAEKHHYEQASTVLQDGLKLLQRVGRLTEQCQLLEQDLELLRPYQILDLLSRGSNDCSAHDKGLILLEALVHEYNLDATHDIKPFRSPASLNYQEFNLFFRQIRRFLTIQEHINLFQHYGEISACIGFPAVLALTAAGFFHRRPEQLTEALKLLYSQADDSRNVLSLIGCLQLLLGDVERAETSFFSSNEADLQCWLQKYPNDKLAAMCDYCHYWLSAGVLSEFPDIITGPVDLEAWFADYNVQAYVHHLDCDRNRLENSCLTNSASLPFAKGLILDAPCSESSTIKVKACNDATKEQGWLLSMPQFLPLRTEELPILIATALALCAFAFANLWPWASRSNNVTSKSYDPSSLALGDIRQNTIADSQVNTVIPLGLSSVEPLTVSSPSDTQLRQLLQRWLDSKAATLAGLRDERLAVVAGPRLLASVRSQRKRDAATKQSQRIEASINSLKIISRTPMRIEVRAVVDYSDQRLSHDGRVLSATAPTTLDVNYIINRNSNLWQIYTYISGP